METGNSWCVYILQCSDGSFYTGATNNLENRLSTHRSGKGARYTRSRLPVSLVYFEEGLDQSAALKREHEIKQLTHAEKFALIS